MKEKKTKTEGMFYLPTAAVRRTAVFAGRTSHCLTTYYGSLTRFFYLSQRSKCTFVVPFIHTHVSVCGSESS